jgi:hypothetical protein
VIISNAGICLDAVTSSEPGISSTAGIC